MRDRAWTCTVEVGCLVGLDSAPHVDVGQHDRNGFSHVGLGVLPVLERQCGELVMPSAYIGVKTWSGWLPETPMARRVGLEK